jgi:hypothetical protein
MRKIPHPVERKILQPLIDSDHEVMLPFQDIITAWLENKEMDSMVALIKDWINDLHDLYEKAERVDELETIIYTIDELTDEATGVMDQIRGYCNG